ncbi:hypothetical protein [Nitratireductor sp. GCM10026969]|uniref:hypothetical protein n=1 Tax=Nitratireductor sp. GCM10026969 TaxID=3252645 RepID=UPI0036117BBC
MKLPAALNRIFVVISAFFSILGLSSIVDGFVTWIGFFRRILDIYQDKVRDPVARVIDWVLPDIIPLPVFVIDILIIWTACFAVFRLFVSFEKQHSVIFGYQRHSWYFYPLAFTLGPFLPLYLKHWTDKRTGRERRMAEEELKEGTEGTEVSRLNRTGKIAIRKRIEAASEWREAANKVHKVFATYYGAATATFVLILFINYQLFLQDWSKLGN